MTRLYGIVILLHAYIGWRLAPDLLNDPGLTWLGVGVIGWLMLSAALVPLSMMTRRMSRQPLADRMAWAGFLAMGLFSSLFLLTLLRDVALVGMSIVGFFTDAAGTADPARLIAIRHLSAWLVPAIGIAMSAVGLVVARRLPPVRAVEVPIGDLPPSLQGFTIVQISDVHVGPTIKRKSVSAIVDAVNRLDPDMIAVTGDLVDGSVNRLADDTAPLAGLVARHGTYFVTGNHEYYSGAPAWIRELRRLGLRVLLNEHVTLTHEGATLVIAGVTDFGAHHFDPAQRSDPAAALKGAPAGAIKILLAHQPRTAFAASPAGYHLQLSGHTHGGQFLPWNFFVRLQQPFTAGLHRLGSLWVYISRGTGYWGPPQRLGVPSEITQVRLVCA